MNQHLEHGMKVRAKQDIYGPNTGNRIALFNEVQTLSMRCGCLCFCEFVIHGPASADLTILFEIIPEPMTAEEAMEKVIEWYTDFGRVGFSKKLLGIIDEYKKGRE